MVYPDSDGTERFIAGPLFYIRGSSQQHTFTKQIPQVHTYKEAMATTFTLFPLLPTELRLQIWHHTFPAPRRIRVSRWTPGPTALYVNHEAREVVKQCYGLIPQPAARRVFSCYGWINLALDIIDGGGIREAHYVPGHEERCKKIRHIHIDVCTWMEIFHMRIFADQLEVCRADFPNLERVDVIVHENPLTSNETAEELMETMGRQVIRRVEDLEAEWLSEGKIWQSPSVTVDLCSLTRKSITTGDREVCTNIYCETP